MVFFVGDSCNIMRIDNNSDLRKETGKDNLFVIFCFE